MSQKPLFVIVKYVPIMEKMERDKNVIDVAMKVKEEGNAGDLSLLFSIVWGFWGEKEQDGA